MTLNELAQAAIRNIKTREPVRVRIGDALIDVVALMSEKKRGSVLVVGDDGKLAGIFTEQDLLTRVDHSNHAWHGVAVGDVMTKNPVCVKMDDMIAHALRWMHRGGFRRLTRVDEDGRPAGIVSIRDILAYIAAHFPQEFLNLPPDPSREATQPWGG